MLLENLNEAGFVLHFMSEAFGEKKTKHMILNKLSTQALTSFHCMLLTRAECGKDLTLT